MASDSIHQSVHPRIRLTHQSVHPRIRLTHQSVHPRIRLTHQSVHPRIRLTRRSYLTANSVFQSSTTAIPPTPLAWDFWVNRIPEPRLRSRPKPVAIQYLSDLHLERSTTFPRLKPKAPYLALLGDIGDPEKENYQDFLKYCSDWFRMTFVLLGNHECYGKSREAASDQILALCLDRDNLVYLNRCLVEVEGLLIVGATLWSEIKAETVPHLNDFHQIQRLDGSSITRADYLSWHQQDRAWLERVVPRSHHPVVVLTHHLPSMALIHPRYQSYPYQDAFATSLPHLIQDPVRVWLCGHSHCKIERWINGVYCGINAGPEANPTKVVTIE